MAEIALILLVAVFALVALVALYLLARFSIAQGRFDTDAQQRAVNLQRYINGVVEQRVQQANVRVLRPVAGGLDDQPPANVQQRGRVDDVHEIERETARMTSDGDPVRDYYEEQPDAEIAT